MTYGLWNSPLRGIEVNQATLISAFRFFWKEIENADTDTEYYDVEGLKKYSALVLEKEHQEYSDWLNVNCKRYYIPIWDYALNIKWYLNDYRLYEDAYARENCINGVINSGKLDAVVEYIYRKKCIIDDKISRQDIKEQYEKFVRELILVWFEYMPRG